MNRIRNAVAAAIAVIWLAYCGLVLKYTCDHLPAKTVARHQPDSQQDKSDPNHSGIFRVPKNQNNTSQRAGTGENEPAQIQKECDWCSVNWATWFQDFVILIAAGVAWFTLRAIERQIGESKKAADATKCSADTAAQQLRLAVNPIVEVVPSPESVELIPISTSPDQQRFTYGLRIQILNVGPSPARILRIDYRYLITNEPDIAIASQEGFTLGSGRPHETDVLIEISQATRNTMNQDGLMIRLWMMLELQHPITGPFWHTHELWLHQFGARPTLVQDRRDYDGRIQSQGQSEDQP